MPKINKSFKIKWILRTALIVLVLGVSIFLSSAFKNKSKFKGVKVVVIDAGHGGKDPGCNGAMHNEKTVTLAVALKLGKLIEQHMKDVKVVYTRDKDEFIELEQRAKIANDAGADLFISIHCNAAAKFVTYKDKKGKIQYKTWKDKKGKIRKVEVHNPVPYGSATYVMGIKNESGKLTVAKRENSAMLLEDNYETKYDGFDPESDEAYIIMRMWTGAFVEQSGDFAAKIQEEYSKKAGRVDKGVHRESLWVLWRTAMPSVLTEVGFLTNPDEEKFLGSEKGQKYLATSIFRALRRYKDKQEGRDEVKYNDEIENIEAIPIEHYVTSDSTKVKDEVVEEETKDTLTEDEKKLIELKNKSKEISASDEAKYKELIAKADKASTFKKYEEALTNYEAAYKIKTGAELKDKIRKTKSIIEKLQYEQLLADSMAKVNEINKASVDALVKKGNSLFVMKDYSGAKEQYVQALKLKPNDKTIQEKVKSCDKLSAPVEEPPVKNDTVKKKETPDIKVVETPGTEITFKVQFAAGDKEIDVKSDKYKGLENLWNYKVGNIYKYTSGSFSKPDDAVKHQTKVRSLGYKDAFVVAFKNGVRIDYNEAVKLIK